jgi:AraC family transcriptional regulator
MNSCVNRSGNFLGTRVSSRTWGGVTMHSIEQEVGPGRAWHRFPSSTAIVSVVLKEVGGHCEARTDIHQQAIEATGPIATEGHISIVPAGCDVWGYTEGIALVHEARFFVDMETARETVGDDFAQGIFSTPSLMKVDRDILKIARLLAAEARRSWTEPMYGEGLLAALLARITGMGRRQIEKSRVSGLTPKQLRLVKDFIAAHVTETISLTDLAALAGLSRSQFGRAFKSSTGKSPHRWHLEQRLELAKELLTNPRQALVDVALTTGFSEQSHFNHVFRSLMGVTPSAWRHSH